MQGNQATASNQFSNRLGQLLAILNGNYRPLTPAETAELTLLQKLVGDPTAKPSPIPPITQYSIDPLFVATRDLFLTSSPPNMQWTTEGGGSQSFSPGSIIPEVDLNGYGGDPLSNIESGGPFQVVPTGVTGSWNMVVQFAAIYGVLSTDAAAPPPLTIDSTNAQRTVANNTPSDVYSQFTRAYFGALGEIKGSLPLAQRVFAILLQEGLDPAGGSGSGEAQVRADELAQVLRILVKRGVTQSEEQLRRRVNEALDSIQNVSDTLPPSQIGIDLPSLEDQTDYRIVADNIRALQAIYFSAMLEELKLFQVTDKLVELFQDGVLPITRGDAGNFLYRYWKEAPNRISEAERRNFYARCFGFVGGDDGGMPNREFQDLWMRFVSAVSSFIRQNNIDNLLRAAIPAAVSQEAMRKAGRDLAANLTLHGYGMAYFMATEIQKQIKDIITLLSYPDILKAYGANDAWSVIDQVASLELPGGPKNSVRYRTMAAGGATIMAWLALNAKKLASTGSEPVLDVNMIRNPIPNPQKATTNPTDYDLVNACEQWLAVTGAEEQQVEQFAQPKIAPVTTARPTTIPAVARDALEAAGIALPTGLGLGSVGNRRWANH
jgi:hypothetical protein